MFLLLCHPSALVLGKEVLQGDLHVDVLLDRDCQLLWVSLRVALKLEALEAGCVMESLSCICGSHIGAEGDQGSQIEIEDDQWWVTDFLRSDGALGSCVMDSLSGCVMDSLS